MSELTFMGVPRAKIDWCPRIDHGKCIEGCTECVDFCPHDVFELREGQSPRLVVKNPHNCAVFCRACAKACGAEALDFPAKSDTTAHIKQIRQEEAANG